MIREKGHFQLTLRIGHHLRECHLSPQRTEKPGQGKGHTERHVFHICDNSSLLAKLAIYEKETPSPGILSVSLFSWGGLRLDFI